MNEMRKKKLLMQYKFRKPEMGVYVYECIPTGTSYIGCYHDLNARINSSKFKLMGGLHPNKNLQNDWKIYGESNFSVRVLEILPYDEKDETKTDYTEELEALRHKWISKVANSEVI